MMLYRFESGLFFLGMLSQVLLPIITAFCCPSTAFDVTRLKYFNSLGRRHGRELLVPIPLAFVAATMMVRRDIKLRMTSADLASSLKTRFMYIKMISRHVHESKKAKNSRNDDQPHFFHSES
jgi:hypothetical protein